MRAHSHMSPSLRFAMVLAFLFASFAQAATSSPSSQPNVEAHADWPSPVMDSEMHGLFLLDRLEVQSGSGGKALAWDVLGWRGGDYDRVWVKSEGGTALTAGKEGLGDVQALYGRLIWAYFDFQVGLRYERRWGTGDAGRFHGVVALQGLLPYSYEIEPSLFVSEKGDISARLTVAQDLVLAQRLIAQFRLETNAALQKVEAFGVRSGLNDLSLSLRFRYEIRRELAPYVGIAWSTRFGDVTGAPQRPDAELTGFSAVLGLRAWY